jgi:hypothetical protein
MSEFTVQDDDYFIDEETINNATSYMEPPAVDDDAAEPSYAEPDKSFIESPKRPRGAVGYQKKIHDGILSPLFQLAVQNEHTIADSAAILLYGPKLETKLGDLAATSDPVARAVNFITDGTENPAAAAMIAAFPLILQVIRNHEPQLEVKPRGLWTPFKGKDGKRRRISFKFGIKLGRVRNVTHDPEKFTHSVFTNPSILAALEKEGMQIAYNPNGRKR